MKHEEIHQLLALRTYGELDATEEHRLTQHLESCGACSRFAAELAAGLGRVRESGESAPKLPADWVERLRHDVHVRGKRSARSAPLPAFLAGLAAGLVAMALVGRTGDTPVSHLARSADFDREGPYAVFSEAPTPPPPATSRGPLARWKAWTSR